MPSSFICIVFILKELIFTSALNQIISPIPIKMILTEDSCEGLLASINFSLSLFLPGNLRWKWPPPDVPLKVQVVSLFQVSNKGTNSGTGLSGKSL